MLEVKAEESEPSLPKDERIVYKLVRIDENGAVLPATDDDIMVESLIQAESSDEDNEQEHTDQDDEKEERSPMEADNLEECKRRLLKQLEVVDTMLLKVKTEEDQRTTLESTGSGYNGPKFTYKRRRRPNPKYFNVNSIDSAELPPAEFQQAQVKTEPPKASLDEEVHCSSSKVVSAPTHFDTGYNAPPNRLFLDNLSIRELQDTYRDTFGRETSAKDKHWLKRKIAKGLSSINEVNRPQEMLGAQEVQECMLKERLDGQLSAEQPFACTGSMEKPFDNDDVKGKVAPASTISPTASLDASTTTVVSRPSDCHSHLNEVQSLEGKRQRKPNRRYLEDEVVDDLGSYGRIIPSVSSPENQQNTLQPDYALSWKGNSEEEIGMTTKPFGALTSEGSLGIRKRNRSIGIRKAERRAAQLVKMARNARAARRDANNSVRKIKFKLPSAPGQDNDENYEPNEDSADQVSCMLPTMSDDLQPSDTEDTVRKAGSRRKHHRPWTLREVMALVDGVSRCGTGKWADIKRLAFSAIAYRTPVDLKDKWRNLLRASRVHSHSSRQGEKRRKHFSVSIPAPILARVRELAAQPGQTLKLPVIRSTRSRRMIQRKQ